MNAFYKLVFCIVLLIVSILAVNVYRGSSLAASAHSDFSAIVPDTIKIKETSVELPPKTSTYILKNTTLVAPFYANASFLPPLSQNVNCPQVAGSTYEITFLKDRQAIAKLWADRGGCRIASFKSDGTDLLQTNRLFWQQLDGIIQKSNL